MSRAKIEMERLSNNCSMYEPCPLCFKCMVKASHLYLKCENCPVPFCAHDHKKRSYMIRRENFAVTVSEETAQRLKEWEQERCQCNHSRNEE